MSPSSRMRCKWRAGRALRARLRRTARAFGSCARRGRKLRNRSRRTATSVQRWRAKGGAKLVKRVRQKDNPQQKPPGRSCRGCVHLLVLTIETSPRSPLSELVGEDRFSQLLRADLDVAERVLARCCDAACRWREVDAEHRGQQVEVG